MNVSNYILNSQNTAEQNRYTPRNSVSDGTEHGGLGATISSHINGAILKMAPSLWNEHA